jgi:hypothetical protein
MEILILIAAMIVVGLIVGWLAGPTWKNRRAMRIRPLLANALINNPPKIGWLPNSTRPIVCN